MPIDNIAGASVGTSFTTPSSETINTTAESGDATTHDSGLIHFDEVDHSMSDATTTSKESLNPMSMPMASNDPGGIIAQIQQMMMMFMQMVQQMMQGLGIPTPDDSGDLPISGGAGGPSGGGAAGGAGGASGGSSAGGGSSGGTWGDRSVSMENGQIQLGKDWGGWDGVTHGDIGSSHDMEDRKAMLAMLSSEYGLSDTEGEKVTQALYQASRNAGLDADKGTHSESQAAAIKDQNHANIKEAFASAPPGASSAEIIAAIQNAFA